MQKQQTRTCIPVQHAMHALDADVALQVSETLLLAHGHKCYYSDQEELLATTACLPCSC